MIILLITLAYFQNLNEITYMDNISGSNSTDCKALGYKDLEKLDIRLPYIYEYSNEHKSIFVYGSYHTSDPNDSIISDIEIQIKNFKPDLIMYEGDGISFAETKKESVEYYYEMGLARYLSNKNGILDMNLEPSAKSKYQDILKRHTKSDVFLAIVGSQITLLLVSKKNIKFDKFYSQLIDDLESEGFPILDYEKDINYFYKTYEDFYKIPFDLNTFDYKTVEVKFNKTKLNQINQETAHFRDIYMLRLIEDQLLEFDRIYIQIGGRHAIIWEQCIKGILGKKG